MPSLDASHTEAVSQAGTEAGGPERATRVVSGNVSRHLCLFPPWGVGEPGRAADGAPSQHGGGELKTSEVSGKGQRVFFLKTME